MAAIAVNGIQHTVRTASSSNTEETEKGKDEYIHWVDFTPTCEALTFAGKVDIETRDTKYPVDWIELLALCAARTGGTFDKKALIVMKQTAKELQDGKTTIAIQSKDLKYYDYYKEAYDAVLGGMIGEYEIETTDDRGKTYKEKRYGLKAFSPIAKGFPYNDYDDFGSSRSFGYRRKHLGHDMMGQIGTPVIAVESGTVEALGWNQYGGWRIGIRTPDKKRYYYYAHLRQNYPYAEGLQEGSQVTAGDVIGYMGHTGYSTKENVNNIEVTHLHMGIELIFDESQKESDNEIWIDCYQLVRFLYQNRSEVEKIEGTREWKRVHKMTEYGNEKGRNVQK